MSIPPRTRPSVPGTPRQGAALSPALTERDIDLLQSLLDTVPAPLEPLDVSLLDGFLCGVLLQPQPIADVRWLRHVTDADGRALPAGFDVDRLHGLVRRRHAELNDAITRRQWFDPWVFELEADDAGSDVDAVFPWVAGFATALEHFPALMQLDAEALTEPLALLYRHLDPDDLEDADELIEEIESMQPPADLADAVEGLVRACLLLADVSRPVSAPTAHAPRGRRGSAPRR